MSKKAIIWIVLVIIILVVAVSLFSNTNNRNNRTIVAVIPLSGATARTGEFAKRGIDMAVADLKSSRLKVVYEDSQLDPKTAISEFNKYATNDDTIAYLTVGSPVAMALKPLAIQDKYILMSIVSAPAYSSPNDFVFRINGTAAIEMQNVVKQISDVGAKRVAIIYQNDDYGKGLLNSLKQNYSSTLVAEEGFPADATDVRSQITKIKSKNPDVVFIAAYSKSVGLVARQIKDLALGAELICGSACDTPDLLSTAAGGAEGLLVVAPTPKANADFIARHEALYKEEPNYVTIRMYDAVKMLAYADEKCSTSSDYKACMKDAIHSEKDFPGAAFPINFESNGDLQDQFIVKKVVGGVLKVQ